MVIQKLLNCSLVAFTTGVLTAQTTIIYEDDFTRAERTQPGGYTQVLKSSTPYNVASGNVWWRAFWSGSSNSMNVSGERGGLLVSYDGEGPEQRAALIDFEPDQGRVYTLSVEMSVRDAAAGDGFLGVGFASQSDSGFPTAEAAWDAGSEGSYLGEDYTKELGTAVFGWLLERGGRAVPFRGADMDRLSDAEANTEPGFNLFQLKLDTRDEVWTGEYLLNGRSMEAIWFQARPNIRSVFLSVDDVSNGKFDNFSLTVIEP